MAASLFFEWIATPPQTHLYRRHDRFSLIWKNDIRASALLFAPPQKIHISVIIAVDQRDVAYAFINPLT